MANPDNTTPVRKTFRIRSPLSRGAMPYLVAALLASAVMGWYFLVYVPAKLDYFVGLRFRTLTVVSSNVKDKSESLAGAFRTVPMQHFATRVEAHRIRRSYLAAVVPGIQVPPDDAIGLPANAGSAGLQLIARVSVGGEKTDMAAMVPWPEVMAQAGAASRRDFDDLVLATAEGVVVWQRESQTVRIGNLTELLGASDDAGGLWSHSWTVRSAVPAGSSAAQLRSTALLKPVNVGGTSTLLMVQPVALALGSGEGGNPGTEPQMLYVAGLVSQNRVHQQAMRVPMAWLVWFALPVMLLFLALPFLKLATLTSKERYSFFDVGLLALATVMAVGIGAILPFVSMWRSDDRRLERLAGEIERRLAAEAAGVLNLADTLQRMKTTLSERLHPCDAIGSGLIAADPMPADGDVARAELDSRRECRLWEALGRKADLELDVVIWIDEQGTQRRKWTTKAQITGPVPHRPFAHFRDLTRNRLWTLEGDGQPDRPFTMDPLRAPTTSQLGFVFGMEEIDRTHARREFIALNVRPQSVVDPVLPPGYGFAIVDPDGKVLFHSEEGLSLAENFFDETGNAQHVRRQAQAGRIVDWTGDYHGRPHHLRMQPVSVFKGSDWRIVTFEELEPVLAAEVLHQSGILRLGTVNLALVVLVIGMLAACSSRGYLRFRDLLFAASSPDPRWLWVHVGLAAAGAAAIRATYEPAAQQWADWIFGFFLLMPILAIVTSVLARRGMRRLVAVLRWLGGLGAAMPRPRARRAAPQSLWRMTRRLAGAELGLLAILVSALPAAGFARLARVVEDTRAAERWFEAAGQRWAERDGRVRERIFDPNYHQQTRALLEEGFGRSRILLDHDGNYFSYLNALSPLSAGTGLAPTRASHVDPAEGQRVLRALLQWSPFGSEEQPLKYPVLRSSTTHELTLHAPADRTELARLTIDRSPPDLTWRTVLGLAILLVSVAGVYWARRRIMAPVPPIASDLDSAVGSVPTSGNRVVLLIGPPRTKKDEQACEAIARLTGAPPVARIRLLDADVTEGFVATTLAEVSAGIVATGAGRADAAWIHVSNLETQLGDVVSRTRILHLIEKLLEGPRDQRRAVIVTTSVDPIAHFKELFAVECERVYVDALPEVELSRSALLLSRARRCYLPIRADTDYSCVQLGEYRPEKWRTWLKRELNGYRPLAQVGEELEATWNGRTSVSLEELFAAISVRAAASYELLWTSCTRSEKLALIQLAQEGFVTAHSRDVIVPLVARGLVVQRPSLTIFNQTFRDFLRRIEARDKVQEWEQMEGHGLWLTAGRLIGGSLVAGCTFFLLTQDYTLQSVLPLLSGSMVGAPAIRTLFLRLAGGRSGAAWEA